MRRLIALSALAVLTACASATTTTTDAGGDGRAWIYNADAGEAKLAYGTPQSDDVPLMMACAPGSGRVALSQGGLRPGDGIALASGSHRTTFRGTAEPDQLSGGVWMTAEADAADPLLRSFRDTGRLVLAGPGGGGALHAGPADRDAITRFFAACG